jgi:hypothetical protein
MSNNIWQLDKTAMRSSLVVPNHGFGMGDVCPQATGYATALRGASVAVTPIRKRHADAALWATPGSARLPWSPPVT